MYFTAILILLSSVTFASPAAKPVASACSGPQYNNIPGFPASNSGCYPLNYYRTSDLGQTSPDDARARCQQQCTADNQCQSVVAQVNKAVDSDLYSGTCFFFAQGQTVAPRRCADKAYLLEGYYKDNTNDCFLSSSSVSASKYCSSYLGIGIQTVTIIATPITVTTTSTATTYLTVSSSKIVTTIPTNTLLPTSSTTLTVIHIITSTVRLSTASPTTVTVTEVDTSTILTSTYSATDPSGVASGNKRAVAATVPPPSCVTAITPASRLSAACSCLSLTSSTVTTTQNPSYVTVTQTTTSTVPVTVIVSSTSTGSIVTVTSITTTTISITAFTTTLTTTDVQAVTTEVNTENITPMTVVLPVVTTTIATATTTTTDLAVAVQCNAQCTTTSVSEVGYYSNTYTRQIASCHVLDLNYPAQAGLIGYSSSFSPDETDCNAISDCASVTNNNGGASFCVVKLFYQGQVQWRCDSGTYAYHANEVMEGPTDMTVGNQYIFST